MEAGMPHALGATDTQLQGNSTWLVSQPGHSSQHHWHREPAGRGRQLRCLSVRTGSRPTAPAQHSRAQL